MGARRHWLTFESRADVVDSDGAVSTEWVPAFEISTVMPCEVVALSGRELIAAQAVQSRVTTRIGVQYRPGFDASMRAILGETVFNVEAVIPDPDSRIRSVTLLCSSGVNEG